MCMYVQRDGQPIIKEHASRHLETAALSLRVLKCN